MKLKNRLFAYQDIFVDFEITFEEDVPAGKAILAGKYGGYDWITIPTPFDIAKGEKIMVMETAANLLGQPGLRITVGDVRTLVQKFLCGIAFEGEPIGVGLKLMVQDPADPTGKWISLFDYEEEIKEDEPAPVVPKKRSHPKTGDAFPMMPVACLAAASLAGLCMISMRRKYQH